MNPARSIGPALFAGSAAFNQLWMFIIMPIVGALIAGLSYTYLFSKHEPVASLESASEA